MDASHQIQKAIDTEPHVVLNLGLGAPLLGGRLTVAHRIRIYQRMLREAMQQGFQAELQIVPRHVYGGEPLLVVSGYFTDVAQSTLLIWDAMIAAEQDCIALYYPALKEGHLVGPNSQMWGDFNINLFRFFGDDNG